MKLHEIIDLSTQERNVSRLEQIAKIKAKQAKEAKARLQIQKGQQKMLPTDSHQNKSENNKLSLL